MEVKNMLPFFSANCLTEKWGCDGINQGSRRAGSSQVSACGDPARTGSVQALRSISPCCCSWRYRFGHCASKAAGVLNIIVAQLQPGPGCCLGTTPSRRTGSGVLTNSESETELDETSSLVPVHGQCSAGRTG